MHSSSQSWFITAAETDRLGINLNGQCAYLEHTTDCRNHSCYQNTCICIHNENQVGKLAVCKVWAQVLWGSETCSIIILPALQCFALSLHENRLDRFQPHLWFYSKSEQGKGWVLVKYGIVVWQCCLLNTPPCDKSRLTFWKIFLLLSVKISGDAHQQISATQILTLLCSRRTEKGS